jgi:iron-sulfur cluster insertion protein
MIDDSLQEKFFLTENAAQQINKLLSQEQEGFFFRLAVSGGGCSGFQYHFTLDNHKNRDDFAFSSYDAQIIIDETSLSFLEGSTLDYKKELIGSSFQISNPKAQSSCGCGNSFTIPLS